MASVNTNELHLLSIDLGSAPSSLRAVLELGREDVEHWLKRASAAGVALAIVVGPTSVDLYSTEQGRRAAFKPLLESLWALGRNLEGFERVKTTEASGQEVARHLLRQAAGIESTEHGVSCAGCISQAYAGAAANRTLTEPLRELFQLATTTADRSFAETELAAPHSTRASRQVEALSAERIVEEELAAFRAAAANDQDARKSAPAPRPPRRASGTFDACEPGSRVQLRVAPFSLTPASLRRSG